jgi:hypothetical protein
MSSFISLAADEQKKKFFRSRLSFHFAFFPIFLAPRGRENRISSLSFLSVSLSLAQPFSLAPFQFDVRFVFKVVRNAFFIVVLILT